MQSSSERSGVWTRPALLGLFALVALGLVWRIFWVHPWYEATDDTNDASMYILCAKSILAGDGYRYLGEPFTVRPPGFSLLLAPFLAWRGVDFVVFNWIGWFFGVAGVVGLYALLLPRLGTLVSLALAATLALNPAWQNMSNQVMTDVPGVALALGCLLLERWASRHPSAKRDVVLGLAIGLSAYIRTAITMLVPAIFLARAFERWRARGDAASPSWTSFGLRRLCIVPFVVVALLLPWSIRCSLHHPEPPVDQNYLFSYSTGMWNSDPADPASPKRPLSEIFARVPLRASQIVPAVGGRMERHAGEDGTSTADTVFGVTLLAALLALALWRARASEIFAVLVLGVLLFYFGFRDRLVAPVYVVSFAALAELALCTVRRWRNTRTSSAIFAALVLVLGIWDSAPRRDWPRIQAGHEAYLRGAADVHALLPADARVGTTVGWHWSVYLDQPVYSLIFGYRRRGGMVGAEDVVKRRALDHVLFSTFLSDERGLLPMFQSAHGKGTTRGAVTVIPLR